MMDLTGFLQLLIIGVTLVVVGTLIFNADVDGSKAACEAEHPGRECQIVWMPKP